MNYDAFQNLGLDVDETKVSRPAIPSDVYRPIKRCHGCQSVYLTDTHCEACGRSLLYHPIGDPFSSKSLYGFKERYYGSFSPLVKYFPFFENKMSDEAKSFVRHLTKRFDDLLSAFGEADAISAKDRRLFYVEMMELIDELLRYGVKPFSLQRKIESQVLKTGPLLTQELLLYLGETQKENTLSAPWTKLFLGHRFMGAQIEFWLKFMVITATVLMVAVNYYGLISSQVGK